jgi:hypothetical protein
MLQAIAKAVHAAASGNKKIAMFHFQVLSHAHELKDVDPIRFCKAVGVPVSYATEFRKMLGLARVIRHEGLQLKQLH